MPPGAAPLRRALGRLTRCRRVNALAASSGVGGIDGIVAGEAVGQGCGSRHHDFARVWARIAPTSGRGPAT